MSAKYSGLDEFMTVRRHNVSLAAIRRAPWQLARGARKPAPGPTGLRLPTRAAGWTGRPPGTISTVSPLC